MKTSQPGLTPVQEERLRSLQIGDNLLYDHFRRKLEERIEKDRDRVGEKVRELR